MIQMSLLTTAPDKVRRAALATGYRHLLHAIHCHILWMDFIAASAFDLKIPGSDNLS